MSVHEERMIYAIDGDLNQLTITQLAEDRSHKNSRIVFAIEMQSGKTARVQLAFDEAVGLAKLLASFCEQRRVK